MCLTHSSAPGCRKKNSKLKLEAAVCFAADYVVIFSCSGLDMISQYHAKFVNPDLVRKLVI